MSQHYFGIFISKSGSKPITSRIKQYYGEEGCRLPMTSSTYQASVSGKVQGVKIRHLSSRGIYYLGVALNLVILRDAWWTA